MKEKREVVNLRLNGHKELIGDVVQDAKVEYLKFNIKKIVGQAVFPMREVTPDEVSQLRKSGIPSFVLRDGYQLFYAEIDKTVKFAGNQIVKKQKCGEGGCCGRLSAAADIDGGCAKVRMGCKGIERFPWLDYAFEVFNASEENALAIARCDHFETENKKAKSRKKVSISEYAWSASNGVHLSKQSGQRTNNLLT